MKRPSFDSVFNERNLKLLIALVYIGLCIYIGVLIYMKDAESKSAPAPAVATDTATATTATTDTAATTTTTPATEGYRTFPARSSDGVKNPAHLPKVKPKEKFTHDGLTDLERHYTYDNKIIPREYSLY